MSKTLQPFETPMIKHTLKPAEPTLTPEQQAYLVLGHVVGVEKLQVVLDGLKNLSDNLERFTLLLRVGLEPAQAKETLTALGYQS